MTATAEAKLAQYLTEAHAKEKQLEVSLQAHIGMASRDAYKKRLKDHLKETKSHARQVEKRLKQLNGGSISRAIADRISQSVAVAKGPLHAVRGASDEEKQLKNAKTEYSEEHEEIATYTAIETLAEELGDRETAKMARQIRREEERMANFLEKQIPILTKAVIKAEIPAKERRLNGRTGTSRPSSGKRSATSRKATGRKAGSRSKPAAKRSTSRSASGRSRSSRSSSRATGSSRSGRKRGS